MAAKRPIKGKRVKDLAPSKRSAKSVKGGTDIISLVKEKVRSLHTPTTPRPE